MASQWNETWAPSSWATNQWWHSPQTPHTTSTWTLPPPPPASSEPSSSLPPAPWPPTPPSRNNPADQQTDPRPARVPIPSSFKEDDEHYDSNLVFKSTLRKTVEPSAWSRAKGLAGMDIRDVTVAHLSRRGMEEYGLRPLSHGRFTGVILTRNVAETVLLSQIQKRLREDNVDVDATIEAIYKSKNLKPPDKVKEATNFVTPLVEEIFLAMKPWTQVKNYGKNSEQDNQVAQRMQELEEEAAKCKQRLKSAGMEVTPTKVLPLQPPPPAPPRGVLPDSVHEDPPPKRRRTQRGDRKKQYETLLEEPFNVIKQSGQPPPTSMTSIKTWVINLKKTMPADKHKDLDQHIQQVQALLDEGKHTKVQLQEMATRWGLPISLITAAAASPRTLQQHIAADGAKIFRQLQRVVDWAQFLLFYTSKDTSFCYIQSTNLTVAKREYNRVAKLKQLKQLKLPKAEIAIRYWHDKKNYEHFSTLLLSQHQEYIDAWAEEHCLIQRWQPKLHYPFVTKELVKKAHGLLHVANGNGVKARARLRIPFLAHNDFKTNVQEFVSLSQCKDDTGSRSHANATNSCKNTPELSITKDTHHLFPNDDRIMENFESFFEDAPGNVYNQAAFNTWMDKKTFLLLDKSPEDIKTDMERQTPAAVRKHYKKLLDYNKPIPYGYIMMKRKKQWSKGRTIIAYSNTCVGRLLRVAALALQQMLKATWPHRFGNIATPQLWQEVHQLFRANEEQPERELIFLNHDLVAFFNSIPQADIIQSVHYLIAEFSKSNNDILLIISPILSTCAIVSTEITWLRLYGQYVASAHLADQLWIRRYVDNRAIIVDKAALHANPYIWQLSSLQFYKKPVQLEDEHCDDVLGFRINANNRQTRINNQLDYPTDYPWINGYIPMSVFPWLAQKLPSELLRASALTRRGSKTMVFSSGAYYHAGSVGIRTNTRKYPWTSALLAHMVRACTHTNFATVSLLCNVNMATHVDKYNQPGSSNVLAYGLLEVTHDLNMLLHLEQVNEVTWVHCSQPTPQGRAIDANHQDTPTDIKMMVAVSVEDTPEARRANQAVQGAMEAIVQQHPQAHHTAVIRAYRPQHTFIEKLVSPDIVYSLLLTNLQAIYKECTARKGLVCPPQMSHNSNITADLSIFVMPMLQFFPIPDCCFEEVEVPTWIYDKSWSPDFKKDEDAGQTCEPTALLGQMQ
ncbi:unnamed protein product, partial [Symbiodinium sp. KB8]